MCHIGPGLSSQCAQKSDRPLPRGQRKARDPADLGLWKRYSDRSALAELRSATSGFEAVLLLLAKDLKEAYGFPVLVVRPKAMFTTCYANVPEEIEEEFLSKYGDFVRNLYDNTVTVNRIFTGMRNRRSLLM